VTAWSLKFMIIPNSPRRSQLIANNHIICVWCFRTVTYIKRPRKSNSFLEIELWEWKCHKPIPVLFVANLLPIVLQAISLMSSVLMNVTDIYTARMMLLVGPISASTVIRYYSWLTIKFTTMSVVSCWVRCFFWFSFSRTKGLRRSQKVILTFITSSS
jgi:hypothetical protein